MPTDLEVCDLLLKLYNGEQLDFVETLDGVYYGIQHLADCSVVLLRGSWTFQDWLRDFMAVTAPVNFDGLGPVHPGFHIGMEAVRDSVMLRTSGPLVISGHSLGAGRAAQLSGLLKLAGRAPVRRVVFGEPKPGFEQLAKLLADIPSANYRNSDAHGHDPVTDVPLYVPIVEPYVHSCALTDVHASPPPDDEWGPFSYHHLGLYRQGLAAMEESLPKAA